MYNTISIHKPVRSVIIEPITVFPYVEDIVIEESTMKTLNHCAENPLQPEQTAAMDSEEESQVEDSSFSSIDVDALIEEARQQGYRQGQSDAQKQFETELQQRLKEYQVHEINPELERLATLIASIQQQWKAIGKKIEDAVLTLAMNIAQQVIKSEITSNGKTILNQAREAIRHLTGVERIRIRVNPEDEKILKQYRSELITASDSVKELIFDVDESITRGGCIIESESGNVDATIETQMKKILEILTADHELTA